jgi:hypothetical protein
MRIRWPKAGESMRPRSAGEGLAMRRGSGRLLDIGTPELYSANEAFFGGGAG